LAKYPDELLLCRCRCQAVTHDKGVSLWWGVDTRLVWAVEGDGSDVRRLQCVLTVPTTGDGADGETRGAAKQRSNDVTTGRGRVMSAVSGRVYYVVIHAAKIAQGDEARRIDRGYRITLWTVLVAGLLAGCAPASDDAPAQRPAGPGPVTVRVPADAPSIQAAVDVAHPGDLVLIERGVYTESVKVRTPGLTVRGIDRNAVVIDGEFRRGNGITVTAPRAAVENLTVRNHLFNGLLFTGVTDEALHGAGAGGRDYRQLDTARFPPLVGFRATHVTAYNNALYGIYAFDARAGVIRENYTSGHADSGVYVGQCKPCDVRVEANIAERNAVGMEFTNASTGVSVVGNRIVHNRVGLTIATDMLESYAPQSAILVAGNAIVNNAEANTPAQAEGGFGIGVGISGGSDNQVTRNLITRNPRAGIVVADALDFPARDNQVSGNRQVGNGQDLVTAAASATPLGGVPPEPGSNAPPGVSFRDVPPPPEQPGMAEPAALPTDLANEPSGEVDVDSILIPTSAAAVPTVLEHQ